MIHVTKSGEQIPVNMLTERHLRNIIRSIERKAKDGIKIQEYCGFELGAYGDYAVPYYDERIVYGEEAKRHLKMYVYEEALQKLNKELA